jgi:hypothetical protein
MEPRSEFVGLAALKEKLTHQIGLFEGWVNSGAFLSVHHSHYDWWVFPMDEKSQYGWKYCVNSGGYLLIWHSFWLFVIGTKNDKKKKTKKASLPESVRPGTQAERR